jgi:hypothetical protein
MEVKFYGTASVSGVLKIAELIENLKHTHMHARTQARANTHTHTCTCTSHILPANSPVLLR